MDHHEYVLTPVQATQSCPEGGFAMPVPASWDFITDHAVAEKSEVGDGLSIRTVTSSGSSLVQFETPPPQQAT
jgi:hypothetical protein